MTRAQAQESARKLCSTNRDLYQRQSAMTRGGRVPTIDEVRATFHKFHNGAAAPKAFVS